MWIVPVCVWQIQVLLFWNFLEFFSEYVPLWLVKSKDAEPLGIRQAHWTMLNVVAVGQEGGGKMETWDDKPVDGSRNQSSPALRG